MSTSSQQIAALKIDKYFKCTPCIMFRQLKIYKVIIKTNESCMITNYFEMLILITIFIWVLINSRSLIVNINDLKTQKFGFEIKEFHLNICGDIVSFRFNPTIVTVI